YKIKPDELHAAMQSINCTKYDDNADYGKLISNLIFLRENYASTIIIPHATPSDIAEYAEIAYNRGASIPEINHHIEILSDIDHPAAKRLLIEGLKHHNPAVIDAILNN